MKPVEIYTTPFCGFCVAAKHLLNKKGVSYQEVDVSRDSSKRQEMMKRAKGGRTVPQIFIDGKHVGGCDEIYELDRRRALDPMLVA
ncbi:glutaredoxin 3 [Pseudohalocynthiibacter sp. F2068]|jgi:glutaredoxin 3|uniref:glutaredoxin 3 n=1 Tax=Pseudohalocynthiibacter sp. F2068 TaxID=2926418 RepID=UPI001FF5A1E6|nr:glutaredoxin 3 [Pseudohalocynthiibacter sp. F2068]MCK0102819.1 glutaredoxin 3 [Pseudohalocynthiibacter sp. F2068]